MMTSTLEDETQTNRALAHKMYGAVATGDIDTFLSCISPDVTIYEPLFLPYGGRYDGLDGLAVLFETLTSLYDFTTITLGQFAVENDLICAFASIKSKDREHTIDFLERCVAKDGKVVELRIYIHDAGDLIAR